MLAVIAPKARAGTFERRSMGYFADVNRSSCHVVAPGERALNLKTLNKEWKVEFFPFFFLFSLMMICCSIDLGWCDTIQDLCQTRDMTRLMFRAHGFMSSQKKKGKMCKNAQIQGNYIAESNVPTLRIKIDCSL